MVRRRSVNEDLRQAYSYKANVPAVIRPLRRARRRRRLQRTGSRSTRMTSGGDSGTVRSRGGSDTSSVLKTPRTGVAASVRSGSIRVKTYVVVHTATKSPLEFRTLLPTATDSHPHSPGAACQ